MSERSFAVVALILVMACGGSSQSASTADPSGPRVADRYQSMIDRAWQSAVAGENPYRACAALKGTTLHIFQGEDEAAKAEASEAVEACSVPVSVRYFEAYLDDVAGGENSCTDLMRETANLGAMLTTAGEDPSVTGPRRTQILEAIAPRVQDLCPEMADAIL